MTRQKKKKMKRNTKQKMRNKKHSNAKIKKTIRK